MKNFIIEKLSVKSRVQFQWEGIEEKNGFSFDLDIKTINYALDSSVAFVLIVVDINEEDVFCVPIQDYFIANPKYFNKLNNKISINIKFNEENLLSEYENELKELAKSTYIRRDMNIEKIIQ